MAEGGQATNRPGHRILGITKAAFAERAEQRRKDGNGIIGKRITQRRDVQAAEKSLAAQQRALADRIAREAKEVGPKGKKAPAPAPKPPPAPPAGVQGEPAVKESIAAIRAKDSDLGGLLTAELARQSGARKRVLEALADEFEGRTLPVPATLEEALGTLLDAPPES